MPGRLVITREKQYADMIRRYRLYVDGQRVGTIGREESIPIDLTPGEHEVVARIDWCRSNVLRVTIRENETTEVIVSNNLVGGRLFLGLYYVTFGRASYLALRLSPRGFAVVTPEERT